MSYWRPRSKSPALLCFLIALATAHMLAPAASTAAAPARHVVIISVDGLAAYLLDDRKAALPAIRKLAREGAVADGGMKVSNPSVTWPNHTTLVTGVQPEKHGVLANGVLVRGAAGVPVVVDPRKDKHELVRVPTLYDLAHAAGLKTADVNWPCTRGAKTLDDSIPDVPDEITNTTPRLRSELIAAGLLSDATDASFRSLSGAARDHVWTEAACHLIRERKPNLLVLHLLNCDSTQHAEGPQSPPGYTANAYADSCVARVLAALDEAGIRQQTAVFIVADHGFALTPKALRPNALLRQHGLLKVGTGGKLSEAQVHVVSEGGIGLVYCTDPGTAPADRQHVKQLLVGQEGVAEVLEPEQFAAHGLPHPREYTQAPDLVLVAKEGYGVSGSGEGETFVAAGTEARVSAGSHGFLATYPKMNAICIIAGAGIRPGARLSAVENIDIAPTAAKLLGLDQFASDGKVLIAALSEK
jgi:predicted AlkP superfamily pyrophosphatase or phosphodiesterase